MNQSTPVFEESRQNIGAAVMGRNMFGPVRGGAWGDEQWTGWWGDNPPYHYPVFVLTHHSRDPVEMEGGTTFHFVTDGIESALEQAKKAADSKDVMLWGGGHVAQQYLTAGLLDELELHVVPVFLGGGLASSTTSGTRMCDSSRSGPSRRPASPTSSTGFCRAGFRPLHHIGGRRSRAGRGRYGWTAPSRAGGREIDVHGRPMPGEVEATSAAEHQRPTACHRRLPVAPG